MISFVFSLLSRSAFHISSAQPCGACLSPKLPARHNYAGGHPATLISRVAKLLFAGATATLYLSTSGFAQQVSATTASTTSPKLSVSTSTIAFGNVTVGSTATQEVIVTSTGNSPVTLYSASLTGSSFQANSNVSLPVTLAPGKTAIGYLTFKPTSAGKSTATLNIASNASSNSSLSVSLSGTGTTAKHQVELSWQAPGSSAAPISTYHIYRATGTATTYSLLSSSNGTQTNYADTNVQSGLSYAYVVKSVSRTGIESPASDTTRVTIP